MKVSFLELHQFLADKPYSVYQVCLGMIWVDENGKMLAKAEPSKEQFNYDYYINE